MIILQFAYSLIPGGAERFVIDLANELANSNETVLYTLRDDTIGNQGFYVPEISEKVTYINLKIDPGFKPMLIWTFLKILKKEKPDIVHCHLNLVNYFFLLSIIFQKKIRFFNTIHSEAPKEVKSKLEKLIRHYFFKHNFIIPIAISDETKKSYESFYKLNNAPVIYNGRKYTGKSLLFEQVVIEIDKLKRTRETLIFCHPAVYAKLKNQKMLISVFNKLRNIGYDVILLIMGEGFENQNELRAMANDHIHFLGIKSNVSDYLFASDAFCLSSEYEGMPISLIEAFASGCVPICTPVGGCVNTIEHGVTGFLSKTVSEESYLEAIQEFIKNRKSINKENLIRRFHENFSIELCASKYMKLYSE